MSKAEITSGPCAGLYTESPYSASITREQFCFYEMRATAALMQEGLSGEEITDRIIRENIYQYPTERSLKRTARMCIKRLRAMNDEGLTAAIVSQPAAVSKQICLYAMMKDSRLIWDFMLTVIAEKYRNRDTTLSKMDFNVFFMRLQEQDEAVAAWSASTVNKIKQVMTKILVENEYLDNNKSETLNPVLISSVLLNAIKANGDEKALPAFNYFD